MISKNGYIVVDLHLFFCCYNRFAIISILLLLAENGVDGGSFVRVGSGWIILV